MMFRCWLFGHKPIKTYAIPAVWIELSTPYYDGCGRAHRDGYGKCDRCGKQLLIAKTIDPLTSLDRSPKTTSGPTP